MINIVDKHQPREYTSFATDGGVCLCDKQSGSFLVLRYASDLQRLKELLNEIKITDLT